MKQILLIACLATVAHAQIWDLPVDKITLSATKVWANGSLNVNILGAEVNIPANALQLASNVLNLVDVSYNRAMTLNTPVTIDVPFTNLADSVVFKIWGNDWKLKKTNDELYNFELAILIIRTLVDIFQFFYTNFDY